MRFLLRSLSTWHAITVDISSDEDVIFKNHDIAMSSVATRCRPNCFSLLHQMELMVSTGRTSADAEKKLEMA